MQKPLARYADDEDLENLLKSKIRDGDPMLEYISKNKGTGEESPDGVRHGKYSFYFIIYYLPVKALLQIFLVNILILKITNTF